MRPECGCRIESLVKVIKSVLNESSLTKSKNNVRLIPKSYDESRSTTGIGRNLDVVACFDCKLEIGGLVLPYNCVLVAAKMMPMGVIRWPMRSYRSLQPFLEYKAIQPDHYPKPSIASVLK